MTTIKQMEKLLDKVTEKYDLSYSLNGNEKDGYNIEIEYWSDLGEDVLIYLHLEELSFEELLKEMSEYYNSFDAEDHATELYNLHGSRGTPTSLRLLLQDADEQEEMLKNIYNTMFEIYYEKIRK